MLLSLQTCDLVLTRSDTAFAKEVAEYYRRNRDFLKAFEPEREEAFYTEEQQRSILKQEMDQAAKKEAFRFYISEKSNPDQIVGMIALNNIVWGCFQSCFLGYKLNAQLRNQGYMTQGVSAVVTAAFTDLKLHRIEANVMPDNIPSLRVLEKCGFEKEGFSRKYLKINGVWKDHIHMVRINEAV